MEDNSKLIWYLSIWIIAAGVVVFRYMRKDSRGAGLSLAYLLDLWMIHSTVTNVRMQRVYTEQTGTGLRIKR